MIAWPEQCTATDPLGINATVPDHGFANQLVAATELELSADVQLQAFNYLRAHTLAILPPAV